MIKIEKINAELQRLIADVINNELNDPRIIGLVSVSKVDTSRDQKFAKVGITIYDESGNEKQTVAALCGAAGYIRSLVKDRLKIRNMPELLFYYDDSIVYSMHIDSILKGLK